MSFANHRPAAVARLFRSRTCMALQNEHDSTQSSRIFNSADIWKLLTFCYDSFWKRVRPEAVRAERSCRLPLSRDQIALVVLSFASGEPFTPVQIQKALFLTSDKAPDAFARSSQYDFQPYDYGPFDLQVYLDIENLERRGLAQINQAPGNRWRTYAATQSGIAEGRRLAAMLEQDDVAVIERIVNLVRSLSFNDLVSAIYRAYPRMRERSVFRD
jgi:uncharacterized protein